MRVVITAKTHLGSESCVEALTFEGRLLRLFAPDPNSDNHFNDACQIGEVWEIEVGAHPETVPPHNENRTVLQKQRLGAITSFEDLIDQQMPPHNGAAISLFDGLVQMRQFGALYIAESSGVPGYSTMFWRSDQPLTRENHGQNRIRYRYPTPDGGCTLIFSGYQDPLPVIPAGTLLQVSLAQWWQPKGTPDIEPRCYVQLSGWYVADQSTPAEVDTTSSNERPTFEEHIPKLDELLKNIFGYPEFRPLQKEIIENILYKRDSLAVMPTGSGKSLCYQLPATLFPGLTVVVSPLIALMEDQVLELRELGIPAAYLNSTLDYIEYSETVSMVRSGDIKLLYAAPETLTRPETIVLLETLSAERAVDCLVIDEAHCISQWGHDFRPEYRQLAGLRARLPQAVTLAVTATATLRVRQDIKSSLGIANANEFIGSFNRENLVLSVQDKVSGLEQTHAFLQDHKGEAGIIYCSTRDQVDQLAAQLVELSYPALPYHAGMDTGSRRKHQHRFRFEENIIMVATIAFGMGINKTNVRFILHYNLPQNIESYYQQIGRAGRDGLPADCMLLYSYSDIRTIRYFIGQEPPELRRGSEMRLQTLLNFLETHACRRIPLLAYFGEQFQAKDCGACDNCLESKRKSEQKTEKTQQGNTEPATEKVDLSVPARQLITCARETGEIFGSAHLIDILRGSQSKKIRKFKHEKLASHGIGRAYSKDQWKVMASQFIRMGILERIPPHGSLKATSQGLAVLEGEVVWGASPGIRRGTTTRIGQVYDKELFELLRELRAQLAIEKSIPPYAVFHDRTLISMATLFPQNRTEFNQIHGVGQHKSEAYGPRFINLIRKYCQDNQVSPAIRKETKSISQRTRKIWKAFQAGESIDSLSKQLDFTHNTILNHLKKAYENGKSLRLEGLHEYSQISEEEEKQVLAAFTELGDYYLKPVFDALNETISYDQLHLWRLIYQSQSDNDDANPEKSLPSDEPHSQTSN